MGRSPCCAKEGLNRGAWTKTEDIILSEYIRVHGDGGWRNLPQKAGIKRCGKSCRLRWLNYLRPDIKRGDIAPDEEELIIRLHRLLGNRWSLIAGRLPGRTDNEIKNYWNTCLSKKVLSVKNSQPKSRKNLTAKSKSFLVQNRVFKTTPVKVTTAVKLSETVRPNGSINRYGCSNRSSDEAAIKLCNVKETANSSKSWCDLVGNDKEGRNSTCSYMSLELERSPQSDYFAGDAANLAEKLLGLNELSSPDCSLLSPPSDCTADFGFEEFFREPATLVTDANEFEVMSSDQSIMQCVNGFTASDDQGIERFYHHKQQVDWIRELDYIDKSSPGSLSSVLLESAEEREEII